MEIVRRYTTATGGSARVKPRPELQSWQLRTDDGVGYTNFRSARQSELVGQLQKQRRVGRISHDKN